MTDPLALKPKEHPDVRLKCGNCKWFHIGYSNVTCVTKRKVQTTEQACVEYEQYKTTPFDILLKDKYLREIAGQLRNEVSDATLKRYLEELKDLRVSHYINSGSVGIEYGSPEKLTTLAGMFEKIQANQDRVLGIRMELRDIRDKLNNVLEIAQAYLLAQYTELFKNMKNESERNAMIRIALPEVYSMINKVEGTLDRTDLLFDNLKNAHFSYGKTQDAALELWKYRLMMLDGRVRSNG